MTTRIQSGGPSTSVSAGPVAPRTTATPARPFRQVMQVSAGAIVAGAEQAATRLPGGPILAAALRPAPGSVPVGSSAAPEGAVSASASGGSAGAPGAGATAPGGMEGVLADNADQNLYYLQLQERISQENRTYTAVSNVLKARHETVKNAISNIR